MIDGWNEDQANLLLGAMSTVADQHGPQGIGLIEQGLIDGAAVHIFDLEPVASRRRVRPTAVAESLTNDAQRSLAIELLVLVPYADMAVEAPQVDLVDGYAAALGRHPKTLTQLHRVRDGKIRRALLDYSRRSVSAYDAETPRLKKIVQEVHQSIGDRKVAARYAQLETSPEGSLGRTFFTFYRDRSFPLPGEKHSLGELLTPHDCSHILAGFNTDPTGEINVAGFEAGMGVDEFGYEMLLEVVLDFHLGISFGLGTVGLSAETGDLDPDEVMVGIRRGMGCTVDLIHHFDFCSVADRQIDDLRREYRIEGAEGTVIPVPDVAGANPA